MTDFLVQSSEVDEDIEAFVHHIIESYGLQQRPAEFGALLQTVRNIDTSALVEIGTSTGASSWAFRKITDPDALIITVDIRPVVTVGPFPEAENGSGRSHTKPTVEQWGRVIHRVIANSQRHSTRKLVEHLMHEHDEQYIDVLFIDGDHSEEGARRDFRLFAPLVREGGIVAFHDIVDSEWNLEQGNEVLKLWRDLEADPDWETAIYKDTSDETYAGQPVSDVMGIGVAVKTTRLPVNEARPHPTRWLLYKGIEFRLRMLIHLALGAIRRATS